MDKSDKQTQGPKESIWSMLAYPLVIFAFCFAGMFAWFDYMDVGFDFTDSYDVFSWKQSLPIALGAGVGLNFLYFGVLAWQRDRKTRGVKTRVKSEEQIAQEKYKSRFNILPRHLKVGNAIACDNDNGQLLVHKGGFTTQYHCIDYDDVVSWKENFGNLATTRQGVIGLKTNVKQVDNAIVFTIRGDLGPTITLHITTADYRQQIFALLEANLS